MEACKVVCVLLVVFGVVGQSLARVYILDDGEKHYADLAAMASSNDDARVRRDGGHGEGSAGPVHTFQKTDKHAHYKWGVRHHVGHHYG